MFISYSHDGPERADRVLAEAALFKADLHKTRLDYDRAVKAREQAVAPDHGWWEPRNQMGLVAFELADWERAEREFSAGPAPDK